MTTCCVAVQEKSQLSPAFDGLRGSWSAATRRATPQHSSAPTSRLSSFVCVCANTCSPALCQVCIDLDIIAAFWPKSSRMLRLTDD